MLISKINSKIAYLISNIQSMLPISEGSLHYQKHFSAFLDLLYGYSQIIFAYCHCNMVASLLRAHRIGLQVNTNLNSTCGLFC